MSQSVSKRKFEKFYNQHIDKVYRYVFFRLSDKEIVQDLVSEIFLKALKNFASYDPKKSSSAWIMTITKNHLANYWRDSKKAISLDAQFETEEGQTNLADKITFNKSQKLFNQDQDIGHVHDLLKQLGKDEKEIVTLHYLCGYKYSEIAQMKKLKISAVKVSAWRAVKKMRKLVALIIAVVLTNLQNF